MNISALFIKRPVATTLLTIGLALAGILAFRFSAGLAPAPGGLSHHPVAASLPGAEPETMATSVAAPLERQFGRIAGVTEMTSSSYRGTTSIVLQFDLNRNIDGAARDVQAAINAARSYLPTNLPSNPTYRKVNPADAPILILALTSDTADRAKMYDAASTILQQKLSQVEGVGTVFVGGGSLPAVRVELNPTAVHKYGIGLEDVRGLLSSTNVNRPKGQLADAGHSREIRTNDQLFKAGGVPGPDRGLPERGAGAAHGSGRGGGFGGGRAHRGSAQRQDRGDGGHLPVAGGQHHRDGGPDPRPAAAAVGRHSPGHQHLRHGGPQPPHPQFARRMWNCTLVISGTLVILVVFAFLRSVRATLIPGVAVPVSLIGTFGVMYLFGYSLDNLSLMALTIATGFVVDDAIVVLENITRYIEKGDSPLRGGASGGPGDRLHGPVHEHLPGGGLHSPPADGRHGGPPVPRVFRDPVRGHHDLPGGLPDHHPHDVRRPPPAGERPGPRPPLPGQRSGFSNGMRHAYESSLGWALRHSRFMLAPDPAHGGDQYRPVHVHSQGFFPRTGYRPDHRHASRRPRTSPFRPCGRSCRKWWTIIKHDPDVDRRRGFHRRGRRRRLHHQYGAHVHFPEAL